VFQILTKAKATLTELAARSPYGYRRAVLVASLCGAIAVRDPRHWLRTLVGGCGGSRGYFDRDHRRRLSNLRNSVAQLMNKRPTDIETQREEPVIDCVQQALERLDWVERARVRLREDGDVLTGEAFVVPRDDRDLLRRLEEAAKVANSQDWRLHDINTVPTRSVQ
jgi:hypothetical protein